MLRQPPRGGGTSSALQRATALLRGGSPAGRAGSGTSRPAQPSADTEDNDITSYLAGLAKKTSGQSQDRGGGRGGGRGSTTVIPDSDRQPAALSTGSKFLKKKTPAADDQARISAEQTSKPTGNSAGSSSRVLPRGDVDDNEAVGAASPASTAVGLGQRFIKKQQPSVSVSAPVRADSAAATPVQNPPRAGHSAASPRHTVMAARRGPDTRSSLESSNEGMSTYMEGLTTTSNSVRTSEEYGQTKSASPRRSITFHTDKKTVRPASVTAVGALSLPPSASRPVLTPSAAATPTAGAVTTAVRLPTARLAKASSSSEAESISEEDGDDRGSDSHSLRAAATVDSARDSAVSDSTSRVGGSRIRVLDMDDLAPASDTADRRGSGRSGTSVGHFSAATGGRAARDNEASEVDSVPTSVMPSTAVSVAQRSHRAAVIGDSDHDRSLTTEEVASSASASSGSVLPARRPSVGAAIASSAIPAKQPHGAGEQQTVTADSYSEDFDASATALSEPLSSAAELGSHASESSKGRPLSPLPPKRLGHSSAPPSGLAAGGPGGHHRKQGQLRGGSRSQTSGSESEHTSAGQSFSYGSETWHTATPSPRRRERQRTPSSSSSDGSQSYSSKRSDGRRRRRRGTDPTNVHVPRPRATVADACLQTGLDLEEAILRCHWNSPGVLLGSAQLRLAALAAAAGVPASGVQSSQPLLAGLESNGLELPSRPVFSDLLVRQVALTRDFIETQKRLHQCLLATLEGSDYQYTTLEETKQYISTHRKPKLTFEEAVRQVKDDMNMQ